MSFGFTSFSETSFSDDGAVRTDPFSGGAVIIYLNKEVLAFPLQINKMTNFDLLINEQIDIDLNMNRKLDFIMER